MFIWQEENGLVIEMEEKNWSLKFEIRLLVHTTSCDNDKFWEFDGKLKT